MQNAVLIGLSRQMVLTRELDVVANNIANVNSTGYKADGSLFEEYLSSHARGRQGSPISFVQDRGTYIDMSGGALDRTGNPLDLAIDGKGFFAVQTARGVRYTRNGSLQINPQGQLVTADGDAILGDSGPIALQPNDKQISISRDGTISVKTGNSNADQQRGKLKIFTFADMSQLKKDGGSTFNYVGTGAAQDDTKSAVVQGAVEKSNVNGVAQMAHMIEITRSYMQVAAMLQQQNDMNQSAIDKLAEVPA